MKKAEIIFSIVAAAAMIAMFGYKIWKNRTVDANPAYVFAKVYNIHDTENGLINSFKYYYNDVEYNDGLKGFIQLRDSLLLLKISMTNPNLWKHVEGKVATCFTSDSVLTKSWREPPYCK
jgi:hypothetical protein